MKIAIVGSGAVGGYYGACLARSGQDVHFLMRSDYDVVRSEGWRIRSGDKTFTVMPAGVARTPEDIGPVDLLLIALKTTANAVLPDLVRPLLRVDTLIVTLQNGLGQEELLAEHFGADRILGGLCFVCLNRVQPGVIENFGYGSVDLGEFSGPALDRTRAIAGMLQAAGVDCHAVDHLAESRWRKLVWNVPFNGLTIAAGGIDVAQILADAELRGLTEALMEEVIEAARTQGIAIEPSFVEKQVLRTEKMGDYHPSSLLDFLAGRPLEMESIWGEPLRRGRKAGAKLPRLEMLYALLRRLDPGVNP